MKPPLTKADVRIIDEVAAGNSIADIAKSRSAKPDTISDQLEQAKAKLGATTQAELVKRFRDYSGWSGAPADWPHAAALAD